MNTHDMITVLSELEEAKKHIDLVIKLIQDRLNQEAQLPDPITDDGDRNSSRALWVANEK